MGAAQEQKKANGFWGNFLKNRHRRSVKLPVGSSRNSFLQGRRPSSDIRRPSADIRRASKAQYEPAAEDELFGDVVAVASAAVQAQRKPAGKQNAGKGAKAGTPASPSGGPVNSRAVLGMAIGAISPRSPAIISPRSPAVESSPSQAADDLLDSPMSTFSGNLGAQTQGQRPLPFPVQPPLQWWHILMVVACQEGDLDAVKMLVESGIDVNEKVGYVSVHADPCGSPCAPLVCATLETECSVV